MYFTLKFWLLVKFYCILFNWQRNCLKLPVMTIYNLHDWVNTKYQYTFVTILITSVIIGYKIITNLFI